MSEIPSAPVQGGSQLDGGKLNVVGESHRESEARRATEKYFLLDRFNLSGYWTESEFPELVTTVGSRKARSGTQNRTPEADMMEFRATHSATLVIAGFERLARSAEAAAAVSPNQAKAAVAGFIRKDLEDFKQLRERLNSSWRTTATPEVDQAVLEVYGATARVYKEYLDGLGAQPDQMLRATQTLAGHRKTFQDYVPKLEKATGYTSDDGTAASLAFNMRRARSTYMGLAAEAAASKTSKITGVWKVGDFHVRDLLDGTAKVQIRNVNLVTKQDFNAALEAWANS